MAGDSMSVLDRRAAQTEDSIAAHLYSQHAEHFPFSEFAPHVLLHEHVQAHAHLHCDHDHDCEHDIDDDLATHHWTEDRYGNEYRIDCDCPCSDCRAY